jgi:lactococcin 972 family bacteriocin
MRVRKSVMAAVAGAIGVLAVASPALAAVQYVGGGEWRYGVTDVNYSNYYHGSARHQSSVFNNLKGLVRSGCASGGSWSYATQAAATQGNKAYWSKDACN